MNKKYTFSEFPEFETKPKIEKVIKAPPKISEAIQEQRHEKINFKQYLRELNQDQGVDDEFADILAMSTSTVHKEALTASIDFGGEDGKFIITEEILDDIKLLEKDQTITITDEFNDCWYISRSLINQLVFESQEYALSGKFNFDDFIKKLK